MVATNENDSMVAKQHRAPQYNINVVIHLKRSKEEISFAEKETDKLYNLIGSGKETNWATTRIERLHEMIFMPSTDQIKNELLSKLNADDDEDSDSSSEEK